MVVTEPQSSAAPPSIEIEAAGIGAVSPAGWGVSAMREALDGDVQLPLNYVTRPGWQKPMHLRSVPPSAAKLACLTHPRLRRSSPMTRFATAAALEAMGLATLPTHSHDRLGIILCVMTGCVNYSRRFYDEVLRDPSTASPLVFPETVFNAPSSHIAALLSADGVNYTLVGDPGAFVLGLAMAADWLTTNRVDSCLVIGAEELDWIVADSFRLFTRNIVLGEGAAAVFLRRQEKPGEAVQLRAITDAHLFLRDQSRSRAARKMRSDLPPGAERDFLCDGLQGVRRMDAAEFDAWCTWPGRRLSPKRILGEGLSAAAAWQCVSAIDAVQRQKSTNAFVSVVGCNQQAIGVHFAAAAPISDRL